MVSLFEELSTEYSRNSTSPVARGEMMGFVEMIGSPVEDTDFLLVEESRTNVQKMMQLFEELNTDDFRDSKVEGCDSGFGELNADDDVLAERHCAKRGLGTQSERVERIKSTRRRRSQEFHIGKEPDRPSNPDEAVASGAAVRAATPPSAKKYHRVKRRFQDTV